MDYLEKLLNEYYPLHYFAVFRAHELYNVEPYIPLLERPILDLGCGDGAISSMLFNGKIEYGMDPSVEAIARAKTSNAYETYLRGDAHSIPLGDNSLGGIFSNCVLEHIDDIPSLISEISRVLKPGGHFVATCLSPNYYSLHPVFCFLDRPSLRGLRNQMVEKENKLHHHVSVFSGDEYEEMFNSNGMRLLTHKYYAKPSLMSFCSRWDTLSKYIVPYPVLLRHNGILLLYQVARYGIFSKKHETIKKWHEKYFSIYSDRNEDNEKGMCQILVAEKIMTASGRKPNG